ncbi:hypothetical protein [Comamonas sp. JC664]|uniref:hypothetical protein n=1 Tax=Comamonas sp. JC664 TaxID=2801917 RepID=UPI00174841AB|nr:hypothetical protein [Comamonas sp. JC664]MBL0695551.1 hypothetical protein [Comamonas sp. JC664]GHG62185.1 hypothetical protein GCM10012319_00660 [Comamonas sp. KCTC 72670]
MAFRPQVLTQVSDSYSNFAEHYKDIRSFFEIVGVRFAIREYGISLKCVAGNKLFSNASGYLLSDDSSYPFYLWLPSWLGRFYVDPLHVPAGVAVDDSRTRDVKLLAFIWIWLGFNDAYVSDAAGPECWFGVAEPRPEDPDESVVCTADKIWKYFRIERTSQGESDGWLSGGFQKNSIGCDLNGRWHMRRVPLEQLSSYYAIEKSLIRPLGEKFNELAGGLSSSAARPVP